MKFKDVFQKELNVGFFILRELYYQALWAGGFYIGLLWSGLGNWNFLGCLGLVILVRTTRLIWLYNFYPKRAKLEVYKHQRQVSYQQLPPGLCYYGEILLNKTERGCYVVVTGEPFQYDGKLFSPVSFLPE